MKKLSFLLLMFLSQLFFAQANRFMYQVTMKPDSTDRSFVKTEVAYLDISAGKSLFYPENRLKRDSLFARMRQTKNFHFDRDQMQSLRSNLDFIIEKDYGTQKKMFKSRIARDQFVYEEDRPMIWKILPETAKIGDYKAQKAETDFAGRKWFAWFTTEIPFQDGPYKFSGLPGLIVKVEDDKNDYSFDLKETKKIPEMVAFDQRGSEIVVKRSAFLKQQQQFTSNPAQATASFRGGGMRIQADPAQRKKMEERRKEEAQKNNNPIELK